MSSHFVSYEITFTVTHVKEKLASFSTLDTILLITEILECFWYFLIEMSELVYKNQKDQFQIRMCYENS